MRPFADRVPTTIVRPPVVFGPGDKDGFLVFQGIKRTRVHPVPNRSGLPVSLIHADDLCEALVLAADKGERVIADDGTGNSKAAGLYYAAAPELSTWAEVGRMVARGMGCKVFVPRTRKWPFLIPALVGDAIGKLTGKPSIFGMDKLNEASQVGWVCPRRQGAGAAWLRDRCLA